jgi:hypothetical protein
MSEHPDELAAMEHFEREIWPMMLRIERAHRSSDRVLLAVTAATAVACMWVNVTTVNALSQAIVTGFVFALGFLVGQLLFARRMRMRAFELMRKAHEEAVYRLAMDGVEDA